MSIYSGFATRKNEASYMNALFCLNQLICDKILKVVQDEQKQGIDNSPFIRYFIKLFKKIYQMDKIKHLEPQFSKCFGAFAIYIMQNKAELMKTSPK